MSKTNPNSNKKSGGAGFIITLLILSSLSGFSFGGILAGVLLGLGIGKITSIMGSGLDTTTHNRRDRERQAREAEMTRRMQEQEQKKKALEEQKRRHEEVTSIPLTGDKVADQVITAGREMLVTIKRENAAIPDKDLSDMMDNLFIKCEQIFRTVSECPSKAPQVRKFMNYYLPTTLKMLATYRTMEQRGVSYGEMKEARETADSVAATQREQHAAQDQLLQERDMRLREREDYLNRQEVQLNQRSHEVRSEAERILAEARQAAAEIRRKARPVLSGFLRRRCG